MQQAKSRNSAATYKLMEPHWASTTSKEGTLVLNLVCCVSDEKKKN